MPQQSSNTQGNKITQHRHNGSAIIPIEKRARFARRTSPGAGRQAPGCFPVTGRGKTGCSGLSAKDRPASLLARDPKGLLLLRIETDGCWIRASSGCCSLPEKARVYTSMTNGWVHSFAGRAARIVAKGQPSTVALGLFSHRGLKLFAGVFPLSIARSLTPGTRRTGAALAGNPVVEAWCSCRRMAGGRSSKVSEVVGAHGLLVARIGWLSNSLGDL
ncbi:calcium-dependent protein kinase 28 [Striga asiatica]|uniref:Calcium-dependent protein kinase 28 n=1 Tax=Striga asiatica TaxID=4170 RepID=A0A5A7PPE0_STRAF|nr:calcium-dependent protein kinase 28 [Striga asiatica]